jgi:hypothetical protein
MAEFLAARKLRLSAEEREARMMKECRDLLRLAGALGVFFGAWLGRGLGFW